jgi:phage tail P2-like protein
MIALEDISFTDLLAPSIANDPTIKALCATLDDQFRQVTLAIPVVLLLPRLDEITDENLIDVLAHQMHVDFYEPVSTIEEKRTMIRKSIEWHIYKGTAWAVKDIVRTIFSDCTVSMWYEYNPRPAPRNRRYRFRLATALPPTGPDTIARLTRAVYATKNLRSWLDAIDQLLDVTGTFYVGTWHYQQTYFDVPRHVASN